MVELDKDSTSNNESDSELGGEYAPYQVYSDLGRIDPWSVKTMVDEENYYKSLLYGCRDCDRIESSEMFMLDHGCSRNGKSKYLEHEMEAFNRKINRVLDNNNTTTNNNETPKNL